MIGVLWGLGVIGLLGVLDGIGLIVVGPRVSAEERPRSPRRPHGGAQLAAAAPGDTWRPARVPCRSRAVRSYRVCNVHDVMCWRISLCSLCAVTYVERCTSCRLPVGVGAATFPGRAASGSTKSTWPARQGSTGQGSIIRAGQPWGLWCPWCPCVGRMDGTRMRGPSSPAIGVQVARVHRSH